MGRHRIKDRRTAERAHELFRDGAGPRTAAGSQDDLQPAAPGTIDEADSLGLAPGAELFELERLRSMDDVPIMIDRTRIPAALAPGLDLRDVTTMSLYAVLEDRYGIRPTRARLSAEAVAAGGRQARLLDLRPGEPLLRCNQVTEDQLGRRIELCEMSYRGDRYRFRATLEREAASQGRDSASEPVT